MSRYLTLHEIETVADRAFRAYADLPEVQNAGLLVRVDPAVLLNALLDLSIEYRHLSRDGSVLGVTAYEEVGVEICDEEELYFFDGKTVLIETDLLAKDQTGRHNFAVVHEGCHHILKMLCGRRADTGKVLLYRDTNANRTREEWQVDRLTSALLMPRDLVERAMYLTGQDGRIDILNPIWRRPEYDRFCNMCGILGVSKQALCIRMQRLGLLGEVQLRNPNRILTVEMEDDYIG